MKRYGFFIVTNKNKKSRKWNCFVLQYAEEYIQNLVKLKIIKTVIIKNVNNVFSRLEGNLIPLPPLLRLLAFRISLDI